MNRLIKISAYVIAIFVIGMISGHFTFKVLSFSRTITVPDLKGKGMVDANDILRRLRFIHPAGLYHKAGHTFRP